MKLNKGEKMKKLFLLLLTIATFAIGADVKPFVFNDIAPDSASQQAEFDYMLKYKLFGHDYITIGNDVVIQDKSGWNGSAGYMKTNARLSLGGPVLVTGDITMGDQQTLTTGPVRANSMTMGNDNGSFFGGTYVLNTEPSAQIKNIITRSGGQYVTSSDSVPATPDNLTIPTITWPDTISQSIIFDNQLNGDVKTIVVPDGSGQYDIYLDTIQFKLDHQKLIIEMGDGGRLTRIFVKHFLYHDHGQIQVVYRTDSTNYELSQKEYRGNVLFYTDESISIEHSDNAIMQGTLISTKEIYLACNINFAGQLIANQLRIGDTYNGENFRFVKFDPDTLDFPELNKQGGLYEDNQTVIIPIELSDTTDIDVFFTYCFDLKDGVTTDDFNIPPAFPVCGESSITTKIPIGSKTPVDTIKVNVKKDTLVEPSEYLVLRIDSISGAVLPNGKTSGELKIKINDAPVGHVEFDTTKTYKFAENDTGFVDTIKTLNKTATTRFYLDSSFTDRYTLDSITGVLTLVGEPLDYEKAITDVVKITLTDTGNVSVTRNIPITVLDVNEAPVLKDTNTTLPENLIHPFMVVKLVAEDVDTKPDFTQNIFTMLEGDTSLFRVDSDGEVWAKKTFDYETDQKTHTIKVLVQDKKDPTLKDSAIVTISITNSNDGPKFDKHDTTFYVDENKPFKDSVKATDQDGDKITYSIVGTVPFTIDSNGVITSTRTFDYEKEKGFTFKVVASDGTAKDTMNVTVKINDENEPVHTKDTTFTVEEGKTGEIGKVKGEDEDGKPVKFSCDDTVHYHVNPNTGAIGLVTPFDYEQTKSDTLKVFVTDGVFTDTAIVVINVKNVNETPELQPNDSLVVPENCKSCIVGIITAIDPDNDPITYKIVEPGFTIDSNGVIKLTEPLDYETTPKVTITVVAKDPSGASDTAKYTITVTDINEPVHTKDTTCSVKENYTGKVCKITGTDEDKTPVKYIVTDTTNYSIDSTGTLTIKNPIDYEKKTKDTVKVIVTDGEFSDTATVIIRVLDEEEIPEIKSWDDEKPKDTVKTNDPDHKFEWTLCEGDSCETNKEFPHIKKDTTIKVCNAKKTKCDSIVVLFNDAPPVVTLTNAKSTNATIDYITIEEQKDDKIYVNKKDNEITVTVRDTVHKTEKRFNIDVTLDTIKTKDIKLKEYNYLIDETLAKYTSIGGGLVEVKEVIKDNGTEITLTKIVDKKGNPIDTIQTVTYTKKVNGKDVVISYKTDNLTGQKIGDYEVSYMIDSCTKITYFVNDEKKIVTNKEGNIGYTISYEYTDDFGNKAVASVEIIYDDIPPKVEILEPYKMQKFNTNAIPVKWTVNGVTQDTLTLQRLEKGVNSVIRRYVDKAGNESADTVMVIMAEAKDIEVSIVYPVTEINQDKVDSFYSEGNKYNPKQPYTITTLKGDEKPDPVGIGFKVDIALPSVNPTGGLATLDDIVKNGMIPVDDKGNIVGASTKGIPVDKYVEEHCTEEFQNDYRKHGLNIPLYDVKYNLHLWVWTTTANYVNDYSIEYTLNDQDVVSDAGTVEMVVDWLADKDGAVRAKNGHALGTGSYITRLYSKSIAKHRCDYKEQRKGDRTVKKEEDTTIFGFKRPIRK